MSTEVAAATGYVFAAGGELSAAQHDLLAAAYDPLTMDRLTATGVGPGWDCLEIGAGGGSVATWLAERVTPSGSVVATDVEPGQLRAATGLVVWRHDIVNDPLPERAFDLVHARLVLRHLPKREEVLGKLLAALRPGGWLQLDEFDTGYGPCLLASGPAERRRYDEFRAAVATVMRAAGVQPDCGARVAEAMRAAGAADVDVHAEVTVWDRSSPGLGLLAHTSRHLRDALVEAGLSDEDLERVRGVMADPAFRAVSPVMYSVRGRRSS